MRLLRGTSRMVYPFKVKRIIWSLILRNIQEHITTEVFLRAIVAAKCDDTPKSTSLTCPFSVSKILWPLMSLWKEMKRNHLVNSLIGAQEHKNLPMHAVVLMQINQRFYCFSQNVCDLIVIQAWIFLSQLVNKICYRSACAKFHDKPIETQFDFCFFNGNFKIYQSWSSSAFFPFRKKIPSNSGRFGCFERSLKTMNSSSISSRLSVIDSRI